MSIDTRLEDEAERAMNYRILGHQVEVLGLCSSCQARPEYVEHHSHPEGSSSAGVGEPRHPKEGSKQ